MIDGDDVDLEVLAAVLEQEHLVEIFQVFRGLALGFDGQAMDIAAFAHGGPGDGLGVQAAGFHFQVGERHPGGPVFDAGPGKIDFVLVDRWGIFY